MTDFDNQFDALLSDAVGERSAAAPSGRPDFSVLLADRQQRTRRRTAVGATVMLAVGVTGIAAFATGGTDSASTLDGPVGSEGVEYSTTTLLDQAASEGELVWFCEGAIDRSVVFPTTTILDAQTTTVGGHSNSIASADSGFFRSCAQVGNPGEPTATFGDQFPATTTTYVVAPPDDIGSQAYVVAAGDYAIKVADQFCVPLEDLLNFNGWSTGNELPFPGETIMIPPGGCIESPSIPCTARGCAAAIHTLQDGDYLIKIADDYCVDMADVIALNGWASSEELGFPGQQVLIPAPVSDGACPDNGGS